MTGGSSVTRGWWRQMDLFIRFMLDVFARILTQGQASQVMFVLPWGVCEMYVSWVIVLSPLELLHPLSSSWSVSRTYVWQLRKPASGSPKSDSECGFWDKQLWYSLSNFLWYSRWIKSPKLVTLEQISEKRLFCNEDSLIFLALEGIYCLIPQMYARDWNSRLFGLYFHLSLH